jgi:hypothetical protein
VPTDRAKAIQHRDKAAELNEAWRVGAVQSRYSDDGHWYARVTRFPAALFDRNGYVLFATEQEYLSASMSIGKQISVPKPGISALPSYVRLHDTTPDAPPSIGEMSAVEGRERLRLHRTRERDQSLVRQKRKTVRATNGVLACEVCGFDFAAFYGALGDGYAECHHKPVMGDIRPMRDHARRSGCCLQQLPSQASSPPVAHDSPTETDPA